MDKGPLETCAEIIRLHQARLAKFKASKSPKMFEDEIKEEQEDVQFFLGVYQGIINGRKKINE